MSTIQRACSLDQAAVEDLVAGADVTIDPVLARRLAQVVADQAPVGDRLVVLPRLEAVGEGVQVRVRADARVAEEIPRAGGRGAGLEDRVGLARVLLLEVAGAADARDAGADDEDVDVLEMGSGGRGRGVGHRSL